jgi:DNA-binding MurR/RpiR family transcriptional regulator
MLEKAVEVITQSKRIVLFGVSPNSLLGELFRRKMQTIGITISVPLVDEGGIFSHSLTKDDCAILISYAGNQEIREPMRFIRTLKTNEVPIIGITGGGDNFIREHANIVLTISSRERLFSKIAGFSTEISIETILNILFSCCFAKEYKANWDYKLKNSIILEGNARNATLSDMKEENFNF